MAPLPGEHDSDGPTTSGIELESTGEALTDDPATSGQCVVHPTQLTFAGVHAALLRTGRVLFFSFDPRHPDYEFDPNRGLWQIWDPVSGSVTAHAGTGRNLFCSGHCWLADGRLLIAAGQASLIPGTRGADHDVHTFISIGNHFTRRQDMPAARWYPTCVTLPDGNALIAGGSWSGAAPPQQTNHEYEIFFYQTTSLSATRRRFSPGDVGLYPFIHVLPGAAPNGVLFVFSKDTARLFALGSGMTGSWTNAAFSVDAPLSRTYNHQGSCVLLPLLPAAPNRVRMMVIGGQGHGEEGGIPLATHRTAIFEFDRRNPSQSRWRAPLGGHMAFRRFMSDAVTLPTATVLVINGAGKGKADESHEPVMTAELFDPSTETWRTLARINRPRMYHSSALLLPDGRVLIAGNTRHFNPGNPTEDTTLELFSPPYLFRGARPVIQAAQPEMSYRQQYVVATPNASQIASVALLRTGSTTHTNNMDQRYVGLAIEQRHPDRLVVRAPRDGTFAPPGYYMLFIVTGDGIPSVARIIKLHAYLSLESVNYPSYFLRHRDWLCDLTQAVSTLDQNDASFRVVPGLADIDGVSLESRNNRNYFLRHQGFRLKMHRIAGDQLYQADATFRQVPGLADPAAVSFESFNMPGHFIRHRGYQFWVERVASDLGRKDATFRIVSPLRP